MSALREIEAVRQIPGERRRRWFNSEHLDLYVWFTWWGAPTKFQLCYDKPRMEKALTWSREFGFEHEKVDSGETEGLRHKEAAVLVPDGAVDARHVADIFAEAARSLPPRISGFVMDKLNSHPSYGRGA